jgi:DNA helicase II / ATP-dependent DNA helicase PcrA
MNREQLNYKFLQIFNALNAEQQKAVRQIDGPVLVIAGPGTGKTQILSARIGNILLETDYLPDNILCLTYTDAGRIAMRKRLQEMIGADAYRVNIHTFHSFCNQIIQENIAYFKKNTLDAISEIESIDLLKKLIDDLPSSNPLRRMSGDPYYEIDRLKRLFETIKKEGWSSHFIKIKADEYIDDLPQRDDFRYKKKTTLKSGEIFEVGDLKVNDFNKEKKAMDTLKCAADAFDAYQQLLQKHNRYDFDDMINWVINALENDEFILADNQERYQYILVDEFQDTNGSQNRLVEILTSNIEKPNIFVVGDDDQSIFRFQGANVENIEHFKNTYSDCIEKIVLKTNYRSTQAILDCSSSVIENNKERLSHSDKTIIKDLVAGNPSKIKSSIQPIFQIYENFFQEYVGITNQVYNLIHIDKVDASKIAIIFTTNKIGSEFIRFFQTKEIPYYIKKQENLFQIPLAKKMIQIMRYVALERSIPYSADDLLFEILHFDLYKIPPFEIAKASVRVGDLRHENKTSLRTYLQDWVNVKNPTLFENKPHDGIIELTNLLEQWIRDSFNKTVIDVCESMMIEGKLLEFALQSEDKIWHLDVLRSLFNFIKDEMHRHPDNSLSSLVSVIDNMNEQELPIELFRTYGVENGVNLLTAHSAKGLEFQHVFLMNATAESWEKKKVPNSNFKFPDTILKTNKEDDKGKNLEEKRRLFFVAMTRAEEYLYISWSKQNDAEKPIEPSLFISEITDKITIEKNQIRFDQTDVEEYLGIYLLRNKQPVLQETEHDFVAAIVARFEMNVTALNNYLNCPLRFYYNNILRVPSGRSEASTFGSAIHHALERLFKKMQENNNEFKPLDDLLQDFKWFMNRHRESFTPQGLKRKLEHGTSILTDLYEANKDTWSKVVAIERMFKGVVVGGVPLKGMLDKMEFNYNDVTIVDYKTGKPANSKDRILPPTARKPTGGDYWRQGVFYKILVDNYKPKDYCVIKTVFQYVEPDDDGVYTSKEIVPTPDDIREVSTQIKDTWHKIQAHDFYTGCGDEECTWCNFTKEHSLYRELIEKGKDDDEW